MMALLSLAGERTAEHFYLPSLLIIASFLSGNNRERVDGSTIF